MWLANPHPILQGGPLLSMAKAVFIPPAELVVFLRLSTQQEKVPNAPAFGTFGGDEGDRTPYLLNAILSHILVRINRDSKSAETSHFRVASSPRFQYRTSSFNTYSLRRLDGQIFRHLWYKFKALPQYVRRNVSAFKTRF